MSKVIITSPEELSSLIQSSFEKAVRSYLPKLQSTEDQLLNIEEAADYLNLAKQTLYGFTSKNKIPHIKRAKRLLFKKSDLDQWLMEGSRNGKSSNPQNF